MPQARAIIPLYTPDKDYVSKALVFLIVLYVLSYRWVLFSRAVPFRQPHQQLFTHSTGMMNSCAFLSSQHTHTHHLHTHTPLTHHLHTHTPLTHTHTHTTYTHTHHLHTHTHTHGTHRNHSRNTHTIKSNVYVNPFEQESIVDKPVTLGFESFGHLASEQTTHRQ